MIEQPFKLTLLLYLKTGIFTIPQNLLILILKTAVSSNLYIAVFGSFRHKKIYMKPFDPIIKYGDKNTILLGIASNIKDCVLVEPAVRLTLDSPHGLHGNLILGIPAAINLDVVYLRLADSILQVIFQYYLDAEPQSSHFGNANHVLESVSSSLFYRETEKLLQNIGMRFDLAGRFLKGIQFITEPEESSRQGGYLTETLKKGLGIDLGLRVLTKGRRAMPLRIFVPIKTKDSVIETVYKNLEQMLLLQYSHADEKNLSNLKLTENLIFKDTELIIQRAKEKKNTRRKILYHLKPIIDSSEKGLNFFRGDSFYDRLNQSETEDSQGKTKRSFNLYNSFLNQLPQPESLSEIPMPVISSFEIPATDKSDIAAYILPPVSLDLFVTVELDEAPKPEIAGKQWYFNTKAETKSSAHYYSPGLSSLSNALAYTGSSSKKDQQDEIISRGQIGQRSYAPHPLQASNYLFRPLLRKPFKITKNIIRERVFAVHPLEKQFLLYPYRSDFEKYAKTLDIDQTSMHPKVQDFSRRNFARRRQVTHPLDPNPPENLGRRHTDKKNF